MSDPQDQRTAEEIYNDPDYDGQGKSGPEETQGGMNVIAYLFGFIMLGGLGAIVFFALKFAG